MSLPIAKHVITGTAQAALPESLRQSIIRFFHLFSVMAASNSSYDMFYYYTPYAICCAICMYYIAVEHNIR